MKGRWLALVMCAVMAVALFMTVLSAALDSNNNLWVKHSQNFGVGGLGHGYLRGKGHRTTIPNDVDIPYWSTGSWWEYDIPIKFTYISNSTAIVLDITQHVRYTVVGIEPYTANDTSYDTYRLDGSGTIDGNVYVSGFNLNIIGTVEAHKWVTRADMAVVREETAIYGTIDVMLQTSDFTLIYNNTYSPPLENYDFPLNVGEEWHLRTNVATDGYYWFEGIDIFGYQLNETSSNFNDNRSLRGTAICNASANVLVNQNTYEAYQVLQKDSDNNTIADIWYAPGVENYITMYVQSFNGGNISAEPTEIRLTDFSLAHEPFNLDFAIEPSTAGVGSGVWINGSTEGGAEVVVSIPITGAEHNTTAATSGGFSIHITAPDVPDATPTTYDVGSHGIIVSAHSNGEWAHNVHTLSLIGPDLYVFPEDIVLEPPVPLINTWINITVHIHNNDVMAVDNVPVFLYLNGSEIKNVTLPHIAVDSYAEINLNYSLFGLEGNWYTVSVAVLSPAGMNETDTSNNLAEKRFKINIPPIPIITVSNLEASTYKDITFNASQSYDPDGRTLDGYMWDFGDGNVSDWLHSPIAVHHYSDGPRTYTVRLWVKDSDGGVSPTPAMVELNISNTPPSALLEVNGKSGSVVLDANLVTFNASASTDIDGTITAYLLEFGDGDNSGWTNATTFEHLYNHSGTYNATLSVMDDDGAISTDTLVLVVANDPPKATIVVESWEVYTYESINVTVTATDEDGIAIIRLDKDGDGVWDVVVNDTATLTTTVSYQDNGNYSLNVWVQDKKSGIYVLERNITVLNRLPQGKLISDRSEVVRGTGPVSFQAIDVSDVDGEVVETYFTVDGKRYNGTELTHEFTTLGKHEVTLHVIDDDGGEYTDTLNILVLNAKPVANFTAPISGTVNIGDTVVFHANASYDPDGDIVQYKWDFGDGTNATGITVNHTWSEPGTYTVVLTVVDNDGANATHALTVRVGGAEGTGTGGPLVGAESTWPYIVIAVIILALAALVLYLGTRQKNEGAEGAGSGEKPKPVKEGRAEKETWVGAGKGAVKGDKEGGKEETPTHSGEEKDEVFEDEDMDGGGWEFVDD